MPRLRVLFCFALLAGCVGFPALPARAQHGGGHGGGGMGPGGRMGPGFSPGMGTYGRPSFGRDNGRGMPNRAPESAGSAGRGRVQLAPLGRWWDEKKFAKGLKLRPDQQQHMDAIFESNRPALAKSLDDLQQEQGRLDAMYRSKSLDETNLYAQIDRVSQARAELGKAYAHYQLQIRSEMDADQLKRLEEQTTKPQ